MSTSSVSTAPASSGVKNLRAIFETKHTDLSTSPPSRGRSPNGSISSNSSRPVSKVRVSFVAVERPGEAGQQVVGLRKVSDLGAIEGRKGPIMKDPVSERLRSTSDESQSTMNGVGLGSILKGSAFETDETTQSIPVVQTEAQPEPHKPDNGMVHGMSTAKSQFNGVQAKAATMRKSLEAKEMPTKKVESKDIPAQTDDTVKTAKLEDAKQTKESRSIPEKLNSQSSTSSIPRKSPIAARKTPITPTAPTNFASRIRGGPNKIQGVIKSAEMAARQRAASGSKESKERREIKPPSVAAKSTASSSRRAAEVDLAKATPASTSKAPRQSLSTKLPSAAMASTAASAARKEATKENTEEEKPKAADRKVTIPQAPRVANTATAASLARKTTRPSLSGHEESRVKSRTSTAPKASSEELLARLTKPTACSVNRAHEKIEPTSPTRSRNVSESSSRIPTKKGTRRSLNLADKSRINGVKHETEEETILDPVNEDREQHQASKEVEESKAGDTAPEEEKENARPTTST